MLQKLLVVAATLALAATGAAAYVAPGGKIAAPGAFVIPVAEPPPNVIKKGPQIAKKAPVVVKKAPVIVKKSPVIVKKSPVIVKKSPVIVQKAPPIIVTKKGGPIVKGKLVSKMPAQFVHIRQHRRHKWYGRAVGGVILGSLLAASVYYTYSAPPEDGLCWFWTNSDRERGYWDYCEPPEDE